MSDDENKPIDPRRLTRKKGKVERQSDIGKEFTEPKKGVFYTKKQEYQKELDKRSKELEYVPFDHDRKSRAKSSPVPMLKDKLVPNDLKTPEIQTEKLEKTTFAKFIRGKRRSRQKTRQREKT